MPYVPYIRYKSSSESYLGMVHQSRRRILQGAGTGIAISLAGCTDQSGGDDTTTKTQTQTTKTKSDAQSGSIPIGLLSPMSGKYSPYGQAWVKIYNSMIENIINKDPPLGRSVTTKLQDSKGQPEPALTGARNLINNAGVPLMAIGSSESIVAIEDVLVENKVPFSVVGAGTPQISDRTHKYIWRFASGDDLAGKAWAIHAHNQGYETASVMYLDDPGGLGPKEAFVESFKSLGGTVAAEVSMTSGRSSYRQQLENAFDPSPDATVLAAGVPTGSTILKQWYQMGLDGRWLLSENFVNPDVISKVGTKVLNENVTGAAPGGKGPGFDAFNEFHQSAIGGDPIAFARNTWDSLLTPMFAIQRAGEVSGPAIANNMQAVANPPGKKVSTYEKGMKAIRNGEDINFQGAGSSVDFNENGDVVTDFSFHKVQDSKWTVQSTVKASEILEK